MNYRYLREFPASILPKLEIVVITAEQTHCLTGHHGIRTAVNAARAFVVQAFCGCAVLVCDAVVEGHLAYVDLSPQLDRLRRALILDGFNRSDIKYWREFERGPLEDDFERDCNEWIAQSAEWRAVQTRRLALAESAAAGPTPPPGVPPTVLTQSDGAQTLAKESTAHLAPFAGAAVTPMTSTPTKVASVANAVTTDTRPSAEPSPERFVSERSAIGLLRTKEERRAAVDAYIDEVYAKKGRRITRKDIWRSARYKTRSEFERWQRSAPNTSMGSHERFVRILTEKPHLK